MHSSKLPIPIAKRQFALTRTGFGIALTLILLLSACDSSSGGNIPVNEVFTGQLAFGEQIEHFYSLTEQTTIRFEIVSVVRDPENLLAANTVSIAIGTPTSEGCATGFTFGGTDGAREFIAVPAGDQCLTVFEPGLLLEEQTVTYTIQLTNL